MTDSAVPVTLSLTEIHQDFVDDPDDDFVHISIDHVTLSRQLDGGVNDALRPFHADITVHHGYSSDVCVIGRIAGYITRSGYGIDLEVAGDYYNDDAQTLGSAANAIRDSMEDEILTTVVMLTSITIDPPFRGHKLTATALAELINLLDLPAQESFLVLQCEPMTAQGRLGLGPQRDQAQARLRAHYKSCGFRVWSEEEVCDENPECRHLPVLWMRPPMLRSDQIRGTAR